MSSCVIARGSGRRRCAVTRTSAASSAPASAHSGAGWRPKKLRQRVDAAAGARRAAPAARRAAAAAGAAAAPAGGAASGCGAGALFMGAPSMGNDSITLRAVPQRRARNLRHHRVMWIDTHCHLDAPEFDADRADVVQRARAAGVARLVLPAVQAADFERRARAGAGLRRRLCPGHPPACTSTAPTTPTSTGCVTRCRRTAPTRAWSRWARSASTTSCPASTASASSASTWRS